VFWFLSLRGFYGLQNFLKLLVLPFIRPSDIMPTSEFKVQGGAETNPFNFIVCHIHTGPKTNSCYNMYVASSL